MHDLSHMKKYKRCAIRDSSTRTDESFKDKDVSSRNIRHSLIDDHHSFAMCAAKTTFKAKSTAFSSNVVQPVAQPISQANRYADQRAKEEERDISSLASWFSGGGDRSAPVVAHSPVDSLLVLQLQNGSLKYLADSFVLIGYSTLESFNYDANSSGLSTAVYFNLFALLHLEQLLSHIGYTNSVHINAVKRLEKYLKTKLPDMYWEVRSEVASLFGMLKTNLQHK